MLLPSSSRLPTSRPAKGRATAKGPEPPKPTRSRKAAATAEPVAKPARGAKRDRAAVSVDKEVDAAGDVVLPAGRGKRAKAASVEEPQATERSARRGRGAAAAKEAPASTATRSTRSRR